MFYTPFNSLHLKNNLQAHKINKEIGTHRNIPERNKDMLYDNLRAIKPYSSLWFIYHYLLI